MSKHKKQDKLNRQLEDERRKLKEGKQKQKEYAKAKETPEEKRARRLAKKLAKEQKRKENLGWDEECLTYSNIDNPYGDKHLTEPFIWKKKLEKDGLTHVPKNELAQMTRQKLDDNKRELDKIRRAREEREAVKADYEMIQRDRENQQFVAWNQQEEKFHLKQAKLRSKIRLQEGRPKPIDLLARCADTDPDVDDLTIQMNEPYEYLKGLTLRDIEDLLEDIKVCRVLDGERNTDYWDDVTVIAEDEMEKLRKYDPKSADFIGDRRLGIHQSVMKDVVGILKGKSHHELALLETEIRKKVKKGGPGVDVGYWETLLGQLKAHMARARLRDHHQRTLKDRLLRMKKEQGVKVEPPSSSESDDDEKPGPSKTKPAIAKVPSVAPTDEDSEIIADLWEHLKPEEKREKMYDAYKEHGGYSPSFTTEEVLPFGTEIMDPLEDLHRLQFSRQELKKSGSATSQKDAVLESIARKGMGDDERQFSQEAPLVQQTYLWSDKYRPRKPRYFNRVHTGFEWNKYNQTHYDLDNAPPKIVQGYKFNIFYPDLLDPSKAPEFALLPCGDNEDFAILRFKAGPPYEDIGFKIVNREWEASHKHGYRCQFQNGIFQLWFHFKKYRYRR